MCKYAKTSSPHWAKSGQYHFFWSKSVPRDPKGSRTRFEGSKMSNFSRNWAPFEMIMAKTVQKQVPKAPQSRTNFAPGAKRTPQGPLQKRICVSTTIRSTSWGWSAIRSCIVVFGEGVTKHHYTWSDWTWPSPSAVYSVRIACAVLEGFWWICRQGHAFVRSKIEKELKSQNKSRRISPSAGCADPSPLRVVTRCGEWRHQV